MAKKISITFYLLLLVLITVGHATSARILNEVDSQTIQADSPDDIEHPPIDTTLPSGQIPAADVASPVIPDVAPHVVTDVVPPVVPDVEPPVVPDMTPPVADVVPPVADVAPPVVPDVVPPVDDVAPSVAVVEGHPQLSFFMHDILGGTHPSGRVVTGIVANSDVNNLPFSKNNNRVFPINGGVPLNTVNGIINNNNAPLLVGLNGSPTNTVIQNNGNNNIVNNNGNVIIVGIAVQSILLLSNTHFHVQSQPNYREPYCVLAFFILIYLVSFLL